VQHGDLAIHIQPRAIVVIEGVLAQVHPIREQKLLRRERVTGYHIAWNEIPLKRCIYLKERWPDTALELVTFVSADLLETCLDFLSDTRIPYDGASYQPFDKFCNSLRYQQDVQTVFDSDMERLQSYGQKGVAVLRGEDF